MRFVNLTAHPVVIYNQRMGDQEVVIPSSGEARVDSKLIRLAEVTEENTGVKIPLIAFDSSSTVGLPDPKDGVIFIVSKAVRVAHADRCDLASPDVTADGSRFVNGKLQSVPGLVVNSLKE